MFTALFLSAIILVSGCGIGAKSNQGSGSTGSESSNVPLIPDKSDEQSGNNDIKDNTSDTSVNEEPIIDNNESNGETSSNSETDVPNIQEPSNIGSNLSQPPDESSNIDTENPMQNQPSGNGSSNGNGAASDHQTPERDKRLSSQWNIVDSVAKAGQRYYNDYFSKSQVGTNNGYMYNYSSGRRVDINYLVELGYLDSSYINNKCDIMLFLSEDIKEISNAYVNEAESGFTVFSVLRNPYSSGNYLMSSSLKSGGLIDRTSYNKLLNDYSQNHGSVSRLFPDAYEYGRIFDFIAIHTGKYSDYYARSVFVDDKYAFVTASMGNDTGNIKQYILRRSNSIWEVVLSGIENEPRTRMFVNRALPDFNLSMLPDWSVYDYGDSINVYRTDVLLSMVDRGMFSDASEVEYICGAGNYYYIVMKNQIKYIAVKNGDVWNFVQVSSNYDAERIMEEYISIPPDFIIWDK